MSDDQLTMTTTLPIFASSPEALVKLLYKQAALPPKPLVRIRGRHSDYETGWGLCKTDFDWTLNLMPLIVRGATDRLNYLTVVPASDINNALYDNKKSLKQDEGLDLREWVQRFCDDGAESKRYSSFVFLTPKSALLTLHLSFLSLFLRIIQIFHPLSSLDPSHTYFPQLADHRPLEQLYA